MNRSIIITCNQQVKNFKRSTFVVLCSSMIWLWIVSCQSSVRFTSGSPPETKTSRSTSARNSPSSDAKEPVLPPQPVPGLRTTPITPMQEKILSAAYSWLSVPYRYGSASRSGIDCSGFTMRVYEEVGKLLPRSAREQYLLGQYVTLNELVPGDLIFFNTTGKGVSHVGLYVGDNAMIHASTKNGVITQSLFEPYYSKTFIAAKRLM